MTLEKVGDEESQAFDDNFSNRPSKALGYQTPLEVKSKFGRVTLRC